MSRPQLTKAQEEDLQKLNQMSQQLRNLQNQAMQLESQKMELAKTIEVLEGLPDENEIYRQTGQILFKADVSSTKSELKSKFEILEIHASKASKQVTEYQEATRKLETKVKGFLQM
ncbi:MAG: prefoldin subunit [Candidatus Heimdallarchaeota archaeon]|nr:prefoldin subunit [Candidatus Heimdallarchaeota archaeon]